MLTRNRFGPFTVYIIVAILIPCFVFLDVFWNRPYSRVSFNYLYVNDPLGQLALGFSGALVISAIVSLFRQRIGLQIGLVSSALALILYLITAFAPGSSILSLDSIRSTILSQFMPAVLLLATLVYSIRSLRRSN